MGYSPQGHQELDTIEQWSMHTCMHAHKHAGPSLSSKAQVQRVVNQGREEMQRQGWSSQETTVQPGERILVPPQGTHTTVSELFPELKPPPNERHNYLMKYSSFQRRGDSLITTKTPQETTCGQMKGI